MHKGCLQLIRDQAWGFVFGCLGVMLALASLIVTILAVPQAKPIRAGITQTFSGTPASTNQSTVAPNPTAPLLAPAETLQENIVLKCNECSDPIVVTIKSVKIEPQNNRMVWIITTFNNSLVGQNCSFEQFSLQNSIDDKTFDATTDWPCMLNSGDTTSVTAIFSFIPYTKVAYTLNVIGYDHDARPLPFLPIQITF